MSTNGRKKQWDNARGLMSADALTAYIEKLVQRAGALSSSSYD
jgi:hypothetical protein